MEIEGGSLPKRDYDSDDEAQGLYEEIKFRFRTDKGDPLSLLSISGFKSNFIVISTTEHASAYLLAKKPKDANIIGYIYNEDLKVAEIYNSQDNTTTFVIFDIVLPLNIYFEFAKFFFEKFSAPKVVILDSINPNALPGFPKDKVELPVLRSVANTKAKEGPEVCNPLEDACPLRGVSGDVLTYCEINGISAEAFLLLPSDYDVIIEDILLYEKIASKYKELSKTVEKEFLGKMITKVSSRSLSKDLYL